MHALATRWWAWALLAAVFAAMIAILAELGVDGLSSDLATLVRTLVVVVLAAAVVVANGSWVGWDQVRTRPLLFLVLSGLATGASWLCYGRALDLGTAAQVAPLDKLSVVFVAILATLVLGERLSWAAWLGVGLMVAGAILVARS